MYDRIKQYRESKGLTAKAFEEFSMPGTPSAFLADKNGLLRHIDLGLNGFLDGAIKQLLNE
jgi:hypothetical protein